MKNKMNDLVIPHQLKNFEFLGKRSKLKDDKKAKNLTLSQF